jgi:hypothetical protein
MPMPWPNTLMANSSSIDATIGLKGADAQRAGNQRAESPKEGSPGQSEAAPWVYGP